MMTREILVNATSEAYQYIKATLKLGSQADHLKLTKLFDSNIFEAKNFEDTNLCALTFDWQNLERDRNWWWQLQALPFLNWFVNSFSLRSDKENAHYFTLCVRALECWTLNAKLNKHSPLAWHDHASAYRVRNITNWMLFCQSKDFFTNDDAHAISIAHLISDHLKWLLEDSNYSSYTNHGFDQAMIGLTISLMFEGEQLSSCRSINRERLKRELAFAFTDEGVHKENSPGYQKMMLARLKQLRTLGVLGEKEVSVLGEKYIDSAEKFLKAITLPNGELPMIGDTRIGDAGLNYNQFKNIDVIDFSASGYAIVRGKILDKDLHLIFKSSHLSNYHRHDDDLSIHLFFDNKIILGDGGLGSHNEKDNKRITLRSRSSHNVPYIFGVTPIRDVSKLKHPPTLTIQDDKLTGVTFCYGTPIKREIDISDLSNGKLTITDELLENTNEELALNLFSALNLAPTLNDNELTTPPEIGPRARIRISNSEPLTDYKTYYSEKFGTFSEAIGYTAIAQESSEGCGRKLVMEINLGTHQQPR